MWLVRDRAFSSICVSDLVVPTVLLCRSSILVETCHIKFGGAVVPSGGLRPRRISAISPQLTTARLGHKKLIRIGASLYSMLRQLLLGAVVVLILFHAPWRLLNLPSIIFSIHIVVWLQRGGLLDVFQTLFILVRSFVLIRNCLRILRWLGIVLWNVPPVRGVVFVIAILIWLVIFGPFRRILYIHSYFW